MGSAYFLVVLGIILAKGVGFYRDIAFSGVFGTSVEADIYFQVFNLVNLIFAGIGVALSTLVIKNMNKTENAGGEKAYAASFIRKSTLCLCAVAASVAIFARPIVKYLLLPGLDSSHTDLAVRLMYIMAPSLVFVVVAYIISGVLQNEKVFFITSIMSLPFNAVIIASLFMPKVSLTTVAVFTTVGWALHGAILLPSFFKRKYSFTTPYKPTLQKKNRNPEILWIFISNMMYQLIFYTDRAFVSSTEGMASTFSYASNLFIIICSIFVVAMSTVFFPALSKNYEEGHIDYVNDILGYIITVMAAIFLPYLLVVGLFGEDIIRLVYERGDFTAESTKAVSRIFFIYSLGVLGYITQELFNKILYLAGKYKHSVIGTVSAIVLNMVCNLVITATVPDKDIFGMGLSAKNFFIALSSSVFLFIYAIVIAVSIKGVVGKYLTKRLGADILKIFGCGVCAAAVYVLFNVFMPGLTHGKITFMLALLACGAVYIIALFLSGILIKLIKRKGTN